MKDHAGRQKVSRQLKPTIKTFDDGHDTLTVDTQISTCSSNHRCNLIFETFNICGRKPTKLLMTTGPQIRNVYEPQFAKANH